MPQPDYTSIIPYKIIDIVSLIITNKKFVFNDALLYLYDSKLYEVLCDESAKFWHFSSFKLYALLEEEKENSVFEYPDFA